MRCDPVKAFGGVYAIRKKDDKPEQPSSITVYKMDKRELEKYGEPVLSFEQLELLLEMGFDHRKISKMYDVPAMSILNMERQVKRK